MWRRFFRVTLSGAWDASEAQGSDLWKDTKVYPTLSLSCLINAVRCVTWSIRGYVKRCRGGMQRCRDMSYKCYNRRAKPPCGWMSNRIWRDGVSHKDQRRLPVPELSRETPCTRTTGLTGAWVEPSSLSACSASAGSHGTPRVMSAWRAAPMKPFGLERSGAHRSVGR